MREFSKTYLEKIPTPILKSLNEEIKKIINCRRARYELSQKEHYKNRVTDIPDSYFSGKKYKRTTTDSAYFDIISDDWDVFFDKKYDQEKKYYVYIHYDITTERLKLTKKSEPIGINFPYEPFYIGKGTGDRYLNKSRTNQHKVLIKKAEEIDPKNKVWAQIFKDGLNEKEALILEAKLILFFGCRGLIKKKPHFTGKDYGMLVNNEYPCIPDRFLSDVVRI